MTLDPLSLPVLVSAGHILAEVCGPIGLITLNRAPALNALTLPMVRDLHRLLQHWQRDPAVLGVVVHGAARPGKAPAFCAGGDIRFFHQAALAGDPRLEDFFTEEYALNHLIHHYPKPYIAWMDGICMGGGMGISQGARLRVVTEHSLLAMPETQIGLFPDVGGGWFLSRCPGHVGEFLAVSGQTLDAADALAFGLADVQVSAARWPEVLEALSATSNKSPADLLACVMARAESPQPSSLQPHRAEIDQHFSADTVQQLMQSLAASNTPWAVQTHAQLARRSPLMMAVSHEHVRWARDKSLAEDLCMERNMVRHCFHRMDGQTSETVEGIRALAVDKDHHPAWQHPHVDAVDQRTVDAFFRSPWPEAAHPLRDLGRPT